MSTIDLIRTIFEIAFALCLILALFKEDKLIAFEDKLLAKLASRIRKRRLKKQKNKQNSRKQVVYHRRRPISLNGETPQKMCG